MDRIHQILKNVSDIIKGNIIPTPVVLVDPPSSQEKPVIKPELVDQQLKLEQEKLAKQRLNKEIQNESLGFNQSKSEESIEDYKEDFYEMSVGSIRAIANHAQKILDSLENPNVANNLTESWLQGKIAVTEDYMRTIHDFIMFVSEESDDDSVEAKQGLWDNIRKKREKEGKNYKPAKPGDKDRPDSEQWKKLTKKNK